MPAYRIQYPGAKDRMVEARSPREARAYAAKAFEIERIGSRAVHELTEKGVDLETAGGQP